METVKKTSPNTIYELETLRGLASIYVLIHHSRSFLWIGYSNGLLKHPELFSTVDKILSYFFSIFIYGHQAVIFFFILSGFSIHFKYANQLSNNENDFNLKSYLNRRIKRIYPPFLFALLFTFILDTIGKNIYPITPENSPLTIAKDNFTFNILLKNLSFLINNDLDLWGSNAALWSLKYEWWFYMIYPLLFLLIRKSNTVAFILVFVLYLSSFENNFWPLQLIKDTFSYLIIWWFGVILAEVYFNRIRIKFIYLSLLIVLFPILMVFGNKFKPVISDVLWGLAFAGLLSLIFTLKAKYHSINGLIKFKFLGSFSYTLYVIHIPIIVLIRSFILRTNNSMPITFEYVFLSIFICLIVAWLAHFLIEKPFVRKRT